MNRLIRIRLFVAIAILAGISALGMSATRPVAPAPASAATSAIIPVLPTIHVSARAEVPVMPLVVVRPSAAELHAATKSDVTRLASVSGGGGSDLVGDLLPHARLDMPYYSFGKLMPKASKD